MKKDKERDDILQEVLAASPPNPHGRYIISPRVGKTRLVISLIKRDKPKSILWVTPQKELAKIDIPREFVLWKAKAYLPKLTTTTWKSLKKFTGKFDLIVLDEEQFATENNLANLFSGELEYRNIISMTGTPTRDTNKDKLYESLHLKPIYEISINDAVDKNILSDYQINVVNLKLSSVQDINVKFKDKSFMTSERKQYVYLHNKTEMAIQEKSKTIPFLINKRKNLIYNSKSKQRVAEKIIKNLPGRKLIFCGSTKQAEAVSPNFYNYKTGSDNLLNFIDGKIDELALVNKGGVGVTYRNVDHVIMIQVDSDTNGTTAQKIARVLLKQEGIKPCIWILCVESSKDVNWVDSALQTFDPKKIQYIDESDLDKYLNYEN